MKNNIFYILLLIFLSHNSFSQDSITKYKGKLFVNLYPGLSYNFTKEEQKTGFVMNTALLGYKRKLNDKISGIIIFDVTRTTNNIVVTDSNGTAMNVSYFEGSKYTAFLKMAQIKWQFHKYWSLSVGQLLNTQYLTYQDKFWNHRYVAVTAQEMYRFGNPADFGMRINWAPSKKLSLYLGAFNGEGPFRHQDEHSDFLISGNIEYKPVEQVIIKAYYSNQQNYASDTLTDKNIVALFGGYSIDRFRFGAEYSYVKNADFYKTDYSLISVFSYYDITKKYQIFARYDYVEKSKHLEKNSYIIAGLQYSPAKGFYVSGNYRFFSTGEHNILYLNFGIKF